MKDANDNKTGELVEPPKRPRGRPASGYAMTDAERKAVNRMRRGTRTLTVELPPEVLDGLNEYMKFKGMTKNEVIEKLIRSQLLRKR